MMDTKTPSQGLLIPGAPAAGNGNGGLLAPDNTEAPARRPGEGRKYFSFSQYTKFGLCPEMLLDPTDLGINDMITLIRFAIGLLSDLTAWIKEYRACGTEIPTHVRKECRYVAQACRVLSGSLHYYAYLVAELCEPGHIAADLRICNDPSATDEKRLAALERLVPLFVDGVYRRLRYGSRGDFHRSLRMGTPHLSPREALKSRIRSCLLVIAKEVCGSVTLHEFLVNGHRILHGKMDRALPEEVIGPWYHTAANTVEELTPDLHDPAPSPEVMAELELLPRATGLTPMERLVVYTAVRIRSALPREIAAHAGMSPKAVRVHWCYARRKLSSEQS